MLHGLLIAVAALALLTASAARAQCNPAWRPLESTASLLGTNGPIYDMMVWDPDGSGPATPKLLIGGGFSRAGDVDANCVALYDPITHAWSTLGSGMSGGSGPLVFDFTVLPNGYLVAAGKFTSAGGVSAKNIALWAGTSWWPIGQGLGSESYTSVSSLAVLPSGDLVAGGTFTTSGSVSVKCIARWDGSSWTAMGTGMIPSTGSVRTLTVLPSGDLVAGGTFHTAGGVSASRVARWNGSTWSNLGSGVNDDVSVLAVLPNGDLIAGGEFTNAGGVSANRIARWNGSTWSALGTGVSGEPTPTIRVSALTLLPSGDMIAGGRFTSAGGVIANYIARWNGSSWSALGSGMGNWVSAMALLPNGDLVAGGAFTTAGEVPVSRIARWGLPRMSIPDHPDPTAVDAGETLHLIATVNPDFSDVSVQWQRNGADITDGPAGASPGGGMVSGASGPLPSSPTTVPVTLSISDVQPSDSGSYTAVFSNACGSVTSAPATVTVNPPPCIADFNADTEVDILDFLDFFDAFGQCENAPAPCPSVEANADVNGDTLVDILDFLDFFDAFGQGACP